MNLEIRILNSVCLTQILCLHQKLLKKMNNFYLIMIKFTSNIKKNNIITQLF